MLTESIGLYAAALAAYLMAAFSFSPLLFSPRRSRSVGVMGLALCAVLGWRAVPPFWHAMRIGLYDAQDAVLTAASAFALLMLAGALRSLVRRDSDLNPPDPD